MSKKLRPTSLVLTMKVLLHCRSPKDAQDLDKTAAQYTKACNYISKRYFDNNCKPFTRNVHHNLYYSMRSLFGLKAQEANTVFRTVKARYRTVQTQLHYQVKRYKDKYSNNTFYIDRTPEDLWYPIRFRKPQFALQRKNDWSFSNSKSQHLITISVCNQRRRNKYTFYIPPYFRQYTKAPWKYGTAHYLKRGGKRYLFINVKRKITTLNLKDIRHIIGNDRGQRFIIFAHDDNNHSYQISGLSCRRKRSRFLKKRARLQSRGTRSAKRKLHDISGQENCWMHNKNHCASKALVCRYGKLTAYILENLRGVKFEAMNSPKRNRYSRATWTFYQLGQDLTYKALENRALVLHVNPQYTSQRCPKCGCVMKANRAHSKHTFTCKNKNCNYQSNDDRIGAINIRFLGKLQLLGYRRPFIKHDNQIGYHVKVNKHNKIKYLSRLDAIKASQNSLN